MRLSLSTISGGYLFLTGTLWSMSAIAEGALALGFTPTDSNVAVATNWASPELAHRAAYQFCLKDAPTEEVKSRCDLISDIHRECVGLASGELAYGWGIDQNLEVARQKALAMCQAVGGLNNGCTIKPDTRFNSCDMNDRGR